jgi:periodic tryptophan protein 1
MDTYDDEVVEPSILGGSVMIGTSLGEDGIPVEDKGEMDGEESEEEEEAEAEEAEAAEAEAAMEGALPSGAAGAAAEDSGSGSDSDSDSGLSDDEFDPMGDDDREYDELDVEALTASMAGGNDARQLDSDEEDSDSDDEDTNLQPTDVLCLAAHASPTDDFSNLQVYVYEPPTGNLYVHHDITLPSFPLCCAWGDVDEAGEAGSFVAVGTFDKGIEVWNLDVLSPLEPR